MKVLIVEDDEALAHLLKITLHVGFYAMAKTLARQGQPITESLDVEQLSTLSQALKWLEQTQQRADLIFVEINAPGMDGLTFLNVCQQTYRHKYRDLVVVTERGDKFDVKRCIMAGARDYILKPFEPEELMEHVFNVWHSREAERGK